MKKECDLSKMKSRNNPYAERFDKQVTLRVGANAIEYFKQMSKETGIHFQSLINLYLQDCVASNRKLEMHWPSR